MIWDSNYSMWIEDDSVKTITAGTTTGTDVPVLRRAYCSPKNNYINDLIQPEAIPIDWLRERASRMLDFGEGVERIIKEWKDEQSK